LKRSKREIKPETNATGLTNREQFSPALTSDGRLEILVHDLGESLGTLTDKVTLGFGVGKTQCNFVILANQQYDFREIPF
jgi:hypothetical protein